MKKITAAILLLFCFTLSAETYYIDYASGNDSSNGTSRNSPWKHCPSMDSFTGSYSHLPGDKFVLKGGVTWPGSETPFGIRWSGSETNPDMYIGGQLEETPWGSGYPVIDGESSIPDWSSIIECQNRSFVKLIGLKVVNAGNPGGRSKVGGIRINDSSNIEIAYCRIQPFGTIGIKADNIGDNVKIHHNDLSDVANFYETNKTTGVCDGLEINDNDFHDPGSMMAGGDHVDGIHLFSYKDGFSDGQFTNLKIYNNHWYGDWSAKDTITGVTGCIYIEQRTPNILAKEVFIYNNLIDLDVTGSKWTGSPTTIASVFSIGAEGINVINNTIIVNTPSETAHIFGCGGESTDLVFENNLIVGHDNLIGYFNGTSASEIVTSWDHNITETSQNIVVRNNGESSTWEDWLTLGYDQNSFSIGPFLDLNNKPLSTKTFALNSGKRQLEFTTDKDHNTRPASGSWTIGAYEVALETPPTGPDELNVSN
jgi:hypothetical protein